VKAEESQGYLLLHEVSVSQCLQIPSC